MRFRFSQKTVFHGGSVSVFSKIKKWTVEAMRKKRKDAGQILSTAY
jgi:hypothetical protein